MHANIFTMQICHALSWFLLARSCFIFRYILGTVLSFYNKMLVGKDSRIFSNEAFPGTQSICKIILWSYSPFIRRLAAPLFMAGIQFLMQHIIVRLVFATGLVKRVAEPLNWHDWFKSGELLVLQDKLCLNSKLWSWYINFSCILQWYPMALALDLILVYLWWAWCLSPCHFTLCAKPQSHSFS